MDKKTGPEMLGEFLREAAVLLFVLTPLDILFSGKAAPGRTVAFLMLAAGVFLIVGIVIERVRA